MKILYYDAIDRRVVTDAPPYTYDDRGEALPGLPLDYWVLNGEHELKRLLSLALLTEPYPILESYYQNLSETYGIPGISFFAATFRDAPQLSNRHYFSTRLNCLFELVTETYTPIGWDWVHPWNGGYGQGTRVIRRSSSYSFDELGYGRPRQMMQARADFATWLRSLARPSLLEAFLPVTETEEASVEA